MRTRSAKRCTLPAVISRHLVSGEARFLLQLVPDPTVYEHGLPGVPRKPPSDSDSRSDLAIQTVKEQATLPLALCGALS